MKKKSHNNTNSNNNTSYTTEREKKVILLSRKQLMVDDRPTWFWLSYNRSNIADNCQVAMESDFNKKNEFRVNQTWKGETKATEREIDKTREKHERTRITH